MLQWHGHGATTPSFIEHERILVKPSQNLFNLFNEKWGYSIGLDLYFWAWILPGSLLNSVM